MLTAAAHARGRCQTVQTDNTEWDPDVALAPLGSTEWDPDVALAPHGIYQTGNGKEDES